MSSFRMNSICGAVLPAAALLSTLAGAPAMAAHHSHSSSYASFETKQSNGCTARAPEDWTMVAGKEGAGVDMLSGDRKAYAGWMILPIHRAMQTWYGPAYGDPATSMAAFTCGLLKNIGDYDFRYTSAPKTMGYFTVRTWESHMCKGMYFYHLYNIAGTGPYMEGQDYIESVYVASTLKSAWKTHSALAVSVAASIRGQVHLRIPPPTYSGEGSRVHKKKGEDHSTYNAQLGTEWAYDPDTGDHFQLDYATAWKDGPDGPGYYHKDGNSLKKLTPGWGD